MLRVTCSSLEMLVDEDTDGTSQESDAHEDTDKEDIAACAVRMVCPLPEEGIATRM